MSFYFDWSCVCACAHTCKHATWKTDKILWQFSFHCADSEDWTQIVRLGGSQSLYQLAHFASPLCIDIDFFLRYQNLAINQMVKWTLIWSKTIWGRKYIVSFIKVSWGLFIFHIKFQKFENWSRFFFE